MTNYKNGVRHRFSEKKKPGAHDDRFIASRDGEGCRAVEPTAFAASSVDKAVVAKDLCVWASQAITLRCLLWP